MFLDPSAYLRLDLEGSLGATSTGASFATTTGDMLEVTAFGANTFRVRMGPNTRPDYSLVTGRSRACIFGEPARGVWTFTSGDATLELAAAPLRMRLSWQGTPVFASTTDATTGGWTRLPCFGRGARGGVWTAAFALASGEPVYGLGEKFGPLDKRGQLVHSQVEDARSVNTGITGKNAPFAWSPGMGAGAWGLFVHTPAMVTHGIGHPDWSHRSYALVVDDEALDLFFFAGAAPADILDAYTALTGRATPVPRWSLGLWVSRTCFASPDDAVATARRLRERRIPCDALVLDHASAWRDDSRFDFAWDDERFADPRGTLGAIRELHLRVCVAEHPYVAVDSRLFGQLAQRGYLVKARDGLPYVIAPDDGTGTRAFPPSGIVDFTQPEAYAWWRDAHHDLFADGVDALRADGGEHLPDDAVCASGDWGRRAHNVYPLLYNRCVHDAVAKFQREAGDAPMVWASAGWTGSQRFAVGGTPPAQADWEGLAATLRGGLSWGMTGNPYHGQDVGGFYAPAQPDGELFVRWLQAAVFASHLRLHGRSEREPWAFGPDVEAVCRKWLAFRYRLVPYLEATIATALATGMPVMRAMPLAFPGNALVRGFDTQFMCGDALLVAPVLRAGGEVEIALPPGGWYDLNTRQRLAGRQVVRYRAKLDQFPVFAREGSALPLGRAVQHTAEIDAAQPLELLWVFGRPVQPLAGYAQARIDIADGAPAIRVAPGVKAELWGDAASLPLQAL